MEERKNPKNIRDYGWTPGASVPSHSYLRPKIDKALRRLPHQDTVLDFGCGNGSLTHFLATTLRCQIHAVDSAPDSIEIAQHFHPEINFTLIENTDTLGTCQYDLITAFEVIEHLYDPYSVLRALNVALKPNGFLLISTPYHGYLKNLAISIFDKWDSHHTTHRVGGHIRFYSIKTLRATLQQEGFSLIDVYGAGRLPYLWKSMLVVAQKGS